MNSSYFMSPEWRVRIEAMKSQLLYWRDQCKQQEKKRKLKIKSQYFNRNRKTVQKKNHIFNNTFMLIHMKCFKCNYYPKYIQEMIAFSNCMKNSN